MAQLEQRFIERCADDRELLKRYETESSAALGDVIHRLSGSAGMFGHMELSHVAERTEAALREGASIDGLVRDLINLLDRVQAA